MTNETARYLLLIVFHDYSEYAYTSFASDSLDECRRVARRLRRIRALVDGGRREPDEEIDLPDGNIIYSGQINWMRLFEAVPE